MQTKLALLAALLALAGLAAGAAFAAQSSASAPGVRLTVLVDNYVGDCAAKDKLKPVWGFACLVEARGHTVLFDTGANPEVLKNNLGTLKIDPAKIEAVVISHPHTDHTGGAPGSGVRPGVRAYTPHAIDRHAKGSAALAAAGLVRVPVSTATPLFDGITISEPMRLGDPDADSWEQCLTIDTPRGLVVVVGCAHPGIKPMIERLKQGTGRPVHLVLGGFHLGERPAAEVRATAQALKAMGVARIGATHCNGEAAAAIFREVFGRDYVPAGVGAVVEVAAGSTKGKEAR